MAEGTSVPCKPSPYGLGNGSAGGSQLAVPEELGECSGGLCLTLQFCHDV